MCTAPCGQNEALAITRTAYIEHAGEPNDVVIQQLLPEGVSAERSFEVFTAYNGKSRNYLVVASGYPRVDAGTFWLSNLNNDVTVATPIFKEVTVSYPISSAPYPLNYARLVLNRVHITPDDRILVTFNNGEVHVLDLASKTFKKVFSTIPDSELLSNSYPHATWSETIDTETNSLWSIVRQGTKAFAVNTKLDDYTVGKWLPLTQVQGIHEEFSPDTFINAHMVQVQGAPTRLVIMIESLDDVGFDEIVYVNTETGELENLYANLMEYDILLYCQNNLECDKKRVSAYDPVKQVNRRH